MPSQAFIVPSSPLDRRRLGKFEVLCRLSTGGMSEIYLAHQTGLAGFKKLVVLKTILPDIGGEEDFVRMFLDEARTTAAFAHPNIAQVYELDVDGGVLFMAMEFVQGCTLVEMARACRQAKEPIPIGFTLASVRDTALALHYAHNFTDPRGRKNVVIHRDVAEKNVMVTYEGVTKLLDFGIAKALGRSNRTNVGMVKGTSGYMSPEQIRGEPLDGRSDVFSLGVVLHECLTGMRLFHGKSAEDGMLAALHEEVAPPSRMNRGVPPDVDAVVMRALQREREGRFATALEMARALEKAAPGAIWHPEQSAELVSRHFADRREETRRLLEAQSFGQETTGEIRIDSVIARVKASGERALVTTDVNAAVTRPPPSAAQKVKRTSSNPEVSTSPARPRVLREQGATSGPVMGGAAAVPPPTPPVPPPRSTASPAPPPRSPVPPAYEDDDSEAKTIPAAALPDELKALRDRYKAQLAPRKDKDEGRNKEDTQSDIVPVALRAPEPRPQERPAERAPERPAAGLRPAAPSRSSTGETLSITGKADALAMQRAADDDDAGVRTKVARPVDLPGSADDLNPTLDRTDSVATMSVVRAHKRRMTLMLVFFLVLLATIGVAMMFLLDLGPFARSAAPAPATEAGDAAAPGPAPTPAGAAPAVK